MTRMSRMIMWLSFAFLLSALTAREAKATTYTAASCSESDVQAKVNLAVDGDTVIIPSCPSGVSWGANNTSDAPLTISVAITLQGQGAGTTVLRDNEYKGDSSCQHSNPMISVTSASTAGLRITGFTLTGQALNPFICSAGHISVNGGSHALRIDHITFNTQQTAGVRTYGDIWGVIDHNSFSGTHQQGVVVNHSYWQNVGNFGDKSWAQPDTMGTAAAVYVENNTFNDPKVVGAGCFDAEAGGRLVFRFNSCSFAAVHGNDSSGRVRGTRQFEVYNNTWTAQSSGQGQAIFLRGGTGMVFNNDFSGTGGNSFQSGMIQVISYRDSDGFPPWGFPSGSANRGACDGTTPFDTNDGTTYAKGTASSSSTTDNLVANGSPGWKTNQWVGYSLRDATTLWGSVILSNTSNAIVTLGEIESTTHTWASGDSFQILHASHCFDQIGRGQGVYISGTSPTPIGPINNALDPMYQWLNSYSGSYITTGNDNNYGSIGHLQANRDYYDYTTSFDGTSGVGSGTLASRPSTCTTGVGYWATDQGNWNNSTSGGQGELFVCTTTNTWTLYYTPYTYPHPLTLSSSSGTGPAPPTGLAALVQ